ncbi:hypothetical protein JYU34_012576, partial [Plutella xylostella]
QPGLQTSDGTNKNSQVSSNRASYPASNQWTDTSITEEQTTRSRRELNLGAYCACVPEDILASQ